MSLRSPSIPHLARTHSPTSTTRVSSHGGKVPFLRTLRPPRTLELLPKRLPAFTLLLLALRPPRLRSLAMVAVAATRLRLRPRHERAAITSSGRRRPRTSTTTRNSTTRSKVGSTTISRTERGSATTSTSIVGMTPPTSSRTTFRSCRGPPFQASRVGGRQPLVTSSRSAAALSDRERRGRPRSRSGRRRGGSRGGISVRFLPPHCCTSCLRVRLDVEADTLSLPSLQHDRLHLRSRAR